MRPLRYEPLERLEVPAPVDRVGYIVERCCDKNVLDLGGYDETATDKHGTADWLHGAIGGVARSVIGVDSSSKIPNEGVKTGPNSKIVRGDVTALDPALWGEWKPDMIVAGELLEHLPNALGFLIGLKRLFPRQPLILSTPNATSLTNGLLGAASRESNHHDHLQIYSYKTLNTLCLRAGLDDWQVVPYHVKFTEMAMRMDGITRRLVLGAETVVGWLETAFPLLAGGVILDVKRL
jgi:hypothetical protein